MVKLRIIQIPASEMDNFSYLMYCPKTLQGAAVDPSMKPQLILEKASELGVSIQLLLNTHGHQDHIAGNPLILANSNARLAAHPADIKNPDIPLSDGSHLQVGGGQISVLHTPGHTPGSVIFASGDDLITGDTLFVSRCGRADLPGSDVTQLYYSLQKIKDLPDTTRIYPGHDYGLTPTSTLAWEKRHNDFLRCSDLESFIKLRMS